MAYVNIELRGVAGIVNKKNQDSAHKCEDNTKVLHDNQTKEASRYKCEMNNRAIDTNQIEATAAEMANGGACVYIKNKKLAGATAASIGAADDSERVCGYKCEFVKEVSSFYICKQCKFVAREAVISVCCGETFCNECLNDILQNEQPCPSCSETNVNLVQQAKYQKAIGFLEVRCSRKHNGCSWSGKLASLDKHLGDCEFVEIQCPRECTVEVQRRLLAHHLKADCPLRDYTCPHCNYKSTYRAVTEEHWSVCAYYPLQCPNRCGVHCDRDVMQDHMRMCSLEEIECEFSQVGCTDKFLRKEAEGHMRERVHTHMVLTAKAATRVRHKQENEITMQGMTRYMAEELKKQLTEVKSQIKEEFEQKVKEQEMMFKKRLEELQSAFTKHYREKDSQIQALKQQLFTKDQEMRHLLKRTSQEIQQLHYNGGILPYNITLTDYCDTKSANGRFDSQPMYTHPGGYMFNVRFHPCGLHGNRGTHLSLEVFLWKGDYDKNLVFPAKFTLTIQTCNQYQDQDHRTIDVGCHGRENMRLATTTQFIPNAELNWNPKKKTQYLKDDRMIFKITKITVHLN